MGSPEYSNVVINTSSESYLSESSRSSSDFERVRGSSLVNRDDENIQDSQEIFTRSCPDVRFRTFMSTQAKLIGLGVRHAATNSLMDDLIRDATSQENDALRYITFNGVRKVLLRNSGLLATQHP